MLTVCLCDRNFESVNSRHKSKDTANRNEGWRKNEQDLGNHLGRHRMCFQDGPASPNAAAAWSRRASFGASDSECHGHVAPPYSLRVAMNFGNFFKEGRSQI